MSTKSSIAFVETTEKKMFHIYHEYLDGKYYLETNQERIELPKKLAEKFGKDIEEFKEDMVS